MALPRFERNNYFYGKLLDVAALSQEQRYYNGKRWLLNRLVTGSGVLCGLDVVVDGDGSLVVEPGAAIDSAGREIVVPSAVPVAEVADIPEEESRDLCLAYAEVLTDEVPVRVPDCDSTNNCACGTVLEGYRLYLREIAEVDADPEPPTCALDDFLSADLTERHKLILERIYGVCPDAPELPDDGCVRLARVTRDSPESIRVDFITGTAAVLSHALLYELILCLADRVASLELEQLGYTLTIVGGDGQTGSAHHFLDEPLAVEVQDRGGDPVRDVFVEFRVADEGSLHGLPDEIRGRMPPMSPPRLRPRLTRTDDKGIAVTRWRLARRPETQHVTARAVGSATTVTFSATVSDC